MKKIYIFFLPIFFSSYYALSQCRVDSMPQGLGISPADTLLAPIVRGVPYDTVLQVYVPEEVVVFSDTAIIYWATIDTITGLPTGITYQRYPDVDTTYGPGFQCYRVSGTTTDTTGTYPLIVTGYLKLHAPIYGDTTVTYAQLGQLAQSFPQIPNFGYSLTVTNPNGILQTGKQPEADFELSPNPNSGKFQIKLNSNSETEGNLKIMDALGRMVYSSPVSTRNGSSVTVDMQGLTKGTYLAILQTADGVATRLLDIQ